MILRSETRREKEKVRAKRRRRSGKDRISELPEHIIHHIFSFLPIKCIVSTSLLSKKWRYVWTTNPIIDLHDWRPRYSKPIPKKTKAFMKFVDRVLSFRLDAHSPLIKKFCLDCHDDLDASRVHEWISTVVLRHKVEELVLEASMLYIVVFPSCIFTSESLTLLEIHMHPYLDLPESIYFPKLKTLRLDVRCENENFISKLLSSSPILEELSIKVAYWDIHHLSVLGPNLKRLFITGTYHQNFDVQINAPILELFKYHSSFLAKDFVLHDFLALHDAEIDLSRSANQEGGAGYVATKLFHSLSYVKRLKVSDYSLKLLSCQGHLQTSLPSFCNLIHLEVNIGGWYLEYERGNKEQLLNFLHISPNLKSLIFAEGYRNYESYNNYGCSLDLVPRCLSLHLKSVEFRGFFGTELEMCLLELFLRNARVLRRVVIILSSELSKNWRNKKKVLNEIALFPRGSPECVLHVS